MRSYYLTNSRAVSKLYSFKTHGEILNWRFFSIDYLDKDNLKELAPRCIEVEKDVAIFGIKSWGETRDEISVYNTECEVDNQFEDFDVVAVDPADTQGKIKIPMSDKRKGVVKKAMKLVAKVIIEDEYDTKYRRYLAKTSALERDTWKYQIEDTDFRNSLADVKGKEREEFGNTVFSSGNSHEDYVKALYIECQTLKQKFYNAETIEDLSVLYEDHFNLPMQSHLAIKLGREIVNADEPNERRDVGVGLNF